MHLAAQAQTQNEEAFVSMKQKSCLRLKDLNQQLLI